MSTPPETTPSEEETPSASPMSGPLLDGPEKDGLEGFIAGVVARPVAVTMFMVAIAVFGLVSFGKLPLDLLPEISYPTLTVRTTYAGAAPEDIEDRISERIQEALSTLPHLVRTTSISRAETSDVVLDFDWGTPMTFAVQDVRDKLDGVFLPQGAEKPLILRYDPNLDPILRIGISLPENKGVTPEAAERDLMHLRWLAENRVKRELETIAGVAAVQVRGGLVEEIRVSVDPFKMAAQGLDPAQLSQRLAQENLNASGGLIREGSTEYLVRTLNEFRDIGEIADLAIVRRNDAAIRVRDVANVTRTHAEREVITRLDGREAVEIAIYREAGANIVQLADAVTERVFGTLEQRKNAEQRKNDEQGNNAAAGAKPPGGATVEDHQKTGYLAWQFRKDAHFETLSDQSTFIRDSIQDLKNSGIIGGLLTMLVIWLALRALVPTLIIALSIPISVIVTFAPMYLNHVSLNIMSLGGLALGVGMVVDASIVVLEAVSRRRDLGDDIVTAAIRGTREVAGAITGSTLTSIAVFAPIVFVHGVAGRIFGDQSLTVVSSHLVSLLVAIVLIPMLISRRWLSGEKLAPAEQVTPIHATPAHATPAPPTRGRLMKDISFRGGAFVPSGATLTGRSMLRTGGFFLRLFAGIVYVLYKAVDLALRPLLLAHDWFWGHIQRGYPRLLTWSLHRAWLVVGIAVVLFGLAAWRLTHLGVDLLPEIHQGEFTARIGLSVGTPIESTDKVLSEIDRDVRALPGVKLTAVVVGVEKDTLTRDVEGKHTARLTVRLDSKLANPRDEERVLEQVRHCIEVNPSVTSIDITRPTPFALDAPIQIEVLGYDLDKLRVTGQEVAERLSHVQGLTDVRTSVRTGHPEARVTFDRDKMLEYGLDLDAVSQLVRNQVLGNVSTRFTEGDDRIDVRVIGDDIVLGNLDRVLDLVVNPTSATPVPLRDVAQVSIVQGPAEIRRIGNTRAVLVTAAASGLDLGGVTKKIETALAGIQTPEDVVVQLGGQKREMDDAQQSMAFALILALFLVYVVMASQFESLLQPLIILVTVPLAFVGVVFALDLLHIPVSVVVFIGLILLAGIVVANAIVLITRINQTREQGGALFESVVEAGSTRLRPIYMTANTTVIGLLPMTGWLVAIPLIGAMGSGAGAELRAPMAVTVVTGMTCSTILTLIVIPCIYYLLYRRKEAPPA